MSLTGIGVLLIGIAFLILSIYLAKVLSNTASILEGVSQTVNQLPNQLDGVLHETGKMIQNSNDTLADVNEKLGTLTPLFQIVGDVGESTRKLASSANDFAGSIRKKGQSIDEETRNKRLGGLYGTSALVYYAVQNGKKRRKGSLLRPSSLYIAGEQRVFDIDRMKEEAKEAAREGKYVGSDK
ncbi:DUF948 domain-containing protein [Sporosarcina luteola]|uniref:DUF948 domain-containing protein n=1 Tax=Sporosarcina luteola TaxID=582850 RepID=UPI00203D099C|nr:DUF948 domain-containing protein [Sporosarcina luteola]MCM3743259.1 DUF948 domain-containing protein [Sporosarcina luteola]